MLLVQVQVQVRVRVQVQDEEVEVVGWPVQTLLVFGHESTCVGPLSEIKIKIIVLNGRYNFLPFSSCTFLFSFLAIESNRLQL